MNYIKQIVSFEQWLETHYLAGNAQLLWYKLMAISNRAGWPEWMSVDTQRLTWALQTKSKATFLRCRDALCEAGLIEVKKSKGNGPNRYRIVPFPEGGSNFEPQTIPQTTPQTIPQTIPQAIPQTIPQTEPQTIPIYKQNKTKTKERDKEREKACAEIVGALNTAAGTSYRDTAKKTRELINARLNEGYTLEDFRTVIAMVLFTP